MTIEFINESTAESDLQNIKVGDIFKCRLAESKAIKGLYICLSANVDVVQLLEFQPGHEAPTVAAINTDTIIHDYQVVKITGIRTLAV